MSSKSHDHSFDVDSPMPALEPLDVSKQPVGSVISSEIISIATSDSTSTNNTISIFTSIDFIPDPKVNGKLY